MSAWNMRIVGHDRVAPDQLTANPLEAWRPVAGYDGLYSVSSLGRVRTDARLRRWGKSVRVGHANSDGYLRVSLTKFGRRRKWFVHRLVAGAFIGIAPVGSEVNHKNGDKTDNRLENLEFVSHRENMQHAIDSGLWQPCTGRGESSAVAKLSDAQVLDIRLRYASGELQTTLARDAGVSRSLIGAVVRREIWRHIA